jgi:Tfp pilus assembly protein PilX
MNQLHFRKAPFTLCLPRQAGAITLLTSVIILMLATILIMAVSRTTLMEQRISGNEIRTRQAANAAEAGLNFALAYITQTSIGGVSKPYGADKDKNTFTDDPSAITTITAGTSSAYSYRFFDPRMGQAAISCPAAPGLVACDCGSTEAIAANACPAATPAISCGVTPNFSATPAAYLRTPRIVACGWSDDGLGRAMVSQGVGTVPALAKGPTNPLTAKGGVNVSGSASVTNFYNNLTIWAGNALTNIGNSGKTFVRNPTISPPAASTPPPPPPTTCTSSANYVCVTDKNTIGPDVIDRDPTLSNLGDDDMFFNYFAATTLAAYQEGVASMPAVAPANVSSLDGVKGEAFIVSSDVSTPGSGSIATTMGVTIGSRDQPVVMIIDGNWSGSGNTTIYGVVYVRGNIDFAGNKTIYGAMLVEGAVEVTGSLDVIYDPAVTGNAEALVGRAGMLPGSWRDWK